MKRLLLALPLLIIAADKPQTLKGWKVIEGEWRSEKNGMASTLGTLEYEEPLSKEATLTLRVNIRAWKEGVNGYSYFALYWRHGITGVSRLQVVFNADGRVRASAYPEQSAIPVQASSCALGVGTHQITAKISRTGAQLRVDSQTLQFKMPTDELGKLCFHTNGPDILLTEAKVKSR
ncbi:MAG: hypothetical protein AB1696_04195 [Planctomycetota bacterium]